MAYFRKKGNKYYFTVCISKNNKKIKHEYAGGSTPEECYARYIEYISRIDMSKEYPDAFRMPFSLLLKEWYQKSVLVNCTDNTKEQYLRTIRNHLEPELGNIPIGNITTQLLDTWLTEKRKKYAQSSLEVMYTILRSVFRWCVTIPKYLKDNPTLGLKLPRYFEIKKAPRIFTKEQIHAIFKKYPPKHKLYMPCILSYCTGMRVGECLALQWKDVDLDTRYIQVVSTIYDHNGLFKVEPMPKSRSSVRKISFSQKLYEAFLEQKKRQQYLSAHNDLYYKTDFVCTRDNGRPMRSNDIRTFNSWCNRNFGGLSFHSFRHTHATMLIDHGVDIDYISKRLGHSCVEITSRIYLSVTDVRNKKVMDMLDDVL